MTNPKAQQIAALNDQFRWMGPSQAVPGQLFATRGITALPMEVQMDIITAVRTFHDFPAGDDLYAEHDFGAVTIAGAGRVFFKIDYYADDKMDHGAENPADPAASFRVMTIMLSGEY